MPGTPPTALFSYVTPRASGVCSMTSSNEGRALGSLILPLNGATSFRIAATASRSFSLSECRTSAPTALRGSVRVSGCMVCVLRLATGSVCGAGAVRRLGCALAFPGELFEVRAKGPGLAAQDGPQDERVPDQT